MFKRRPRKFIVNIDNINSLSNLSGWRKSNFGFYHVFQSEFSHMNFKHCLGLKIIVFIDENVYKNNFEQSTALLDTSKPTGSLHAKIHTRAPPTFIFARSARSQRKMNILKE